MWTCPACQAQATDNLAACPRCGARRPTVPAPHLTTCRACGNGVSNRAAACPHCGEPMNVGGWLCSCGARNATHFRACYHCTRARPGKRGPVFVWSGIGILALAWLMPLLTGAALFLGWGFFVGAVFLVAGIVLLALER